VLTAEHIPEHVAQLRVGCSDHAEHLAALVKLVDPQAAGGPRGMSKPPGPPGRVPRDVFARLWETLPIHTIAELIDVKPCSVSSRARRLGLPFKAERYTPDFRRQVLADLVSGRTPKQVCADYLIAPSTLWQWQRQS
jgi:hypothetical protein